MKITTTTPHEQFVYHRDTLTEQDLADYCEELTLLRVRVEDMENTLETNKIDIQEQNDEIEQICYELIPILKDCVRQITDETLVEELKTQLQDLEGIFSRFND